MTSHLHFDPSREPLPPDEELWGPEGPFPDTSGEDEAPDHATDAALRALARTSYHVPDPATPHGDSLHDVSVAVPRDAMWAAVSAWRALAESPAQPTGREARTVIVHALNARQSRRLWPAFAALAATLLAGVVIGRGFSDRGNDISETPSMMATDRSTLSQDTSAMPLMLAQLTSQHFASTEALLVTARQELSGNATDASVAAWARDLLLSTRLLLDTEALRDLRTRRLLQDLELTLALIVQAQSSGRDADARMVRDDLEAGDLLLRVRGATMPTVDSPNDIRGMSE